MKLEFCTYDNLQILRDSLKKNIKFYSNESNEWLKSLTQENKTLFIKSKIDLPENGIKLIISDKPEKDDFENIKILYTALKHLTNCQAADERVWVALTHGMFWEYMQKRWPLTKGAKDEYKFILKNYFFAHGTRSLLTNGLARLWWFGKLTYQEGADDPFYLTEYICKDINGKGFPLLGSNFSNNNYLVSVFLNTIKEYEEKNEVVLTRDQFIKMIRIVNLWGGKMIIDGLPEHVLKSKLIGHLDKIILIKNNSQ